MQESHVMQGRMKGMDIRLPGEFYKSRLESLSNLEFNFSLFCGVTLRKNCIIKAAWSVI